MKLPSPQEITDDLDFLGDWDARYQYIIDLGRQVPSIPENLRLDEFIVHGCQSDVWLIPSREGDVFQFQVDSDAVIVRGLLGLIMAAYHGKTAQEIVDFDMAGFFAAIDLEKHLSPTRGNGLRAIVKKIQGLAEAGV